ncbi:MAG TPA: YfhO family protein [Thermoanaerobaculia bacterium]
MTLRRSALPGILIAAAILPVLFWFYPAFLDHQAPGSRDQGDFFYPIKLYTAARIRAGEIPLWNPLSGTGEPWLANGQSGTFYPPTFLFLLPSPGMAGALFLLFHFLLASWGIHRLLKDEGISDAGALFGALVYCAGGFSASLSWYWNHFGGWAYLPGACALARSGLETRRQRLGLAALIGLSAMAGSPEMTFVVIALAFAFAIATPRREWDGWVAPTLRLTAARAMVGVLLGLALSAWALVPLGELALRSDRTAGFARDQLEVGTVRLGSALTSALGGAESGTSYLSTLYVGAIVLVAAAASFGEARRRRLLWLLASIGIAGLLFASAGWPGSWLRAIPPLNRLRYAAKALALPHLSVSMLAGLGWDRQRFAPGGRVRRVVFCVLGGAAIVVQFLFSKGDALVGFAGVAAAAGFVLVSSGLARGQRLSGVIAGFSAIGLGTALAFAGKPLFPLVPDSEVVREPPMVASFSSVSGRILTPPMRELAQRCLTGASSTSDTLRCQRESLLGYTNLLFGIRTVRTAAALPTRASRRVEGAIDASTDLVAGAGPVSARVLWTPFQPLRIPSMKIGPFFRGPLAPYRPRLSFVHGFRVEPNPDRAWDRVASGQIDLVHEVVLDRAVEQMPRSSTQPLLVARLAEDLPEKVVAEVTSTLPGLLVLTDLWYPGWIAEADGKPVEIRRADGYFRAVPLTEGTHRVVFRYRPLSVIVGGAISAAAILTMAFAAAARPPKSGSVL